MAHGRRNHRRRKAIGDGGRPARTGRPPSVPSGGSPNPARPERSGSRRRERFGRAVADLFEIPPDIVLNVPRLTIVGNLQMIIENHRGLVEYSPGLIRVGGGAGQIVVLGRDLSVGSVLAEDLSIMGRFERIVFEEMPGDAPAAGDQGRPEP